MQGALKYQHKQQPEDSRAGKMRLALDLVGLRLVALGILGEEHNGQDQGDDAHRMHCEGIAPAQQSQVAAGQSHNNVADVVADLLPTQQSIHFLTLVEQGEDSSRIQGVHKAAAHADTEAGQNDQSPVFHEAGHQTGDAENDQAQNHGLAAAQTGGHRNGHKAGDNRAQGRDGHQQLDLLSRLVGEGGADLCQRRGHAHGTHGNKLHRNDCDDPFPMLL